MTGDKVAAAIAAVDGPPTTPPVSIRITVSTGRQIGIVVPGDLAGQEALDLIAFVASPEGLSAELTKRRRSAAGRLFVPARA